MPFRVSRSVRFTYCVCEYGRRPLCFVCVCVHFLISLACYKISDSSSSKSPYIRSLFSTDMSVWRNRSNGVAEQTGDVPMFAGNKVYDVYVYRRTVRHTKREPETSKTSGQSVVKLMHDATMNSIHITDHTYSAARLLGEKKKHRRHSRTYILFAGWMCGCRTEKKCNYFSCRNCSIRRINGSLENINLRISHFRAESRKM